VSRLNTNNYHETSPFRFDNNKLVFDKELWTKIHDKWIGIEIIKIFGIPLLESHVLYNNIPEDSDELYWIIYSLFNEWTAGNHWYHLIPESIIIEIPDKEIDILINTSDTLIYQTKEVENFINILPETISLLKKTMTGIDYFIKTQNTSTKKDFKPISVDTSYEALKHILLSKECNRSFKKTKKKQRKNYLLLSPWRCNVSSDNEFRVFIIDGKIAGISQQDIYKISVTMLNVWSSMADEIYNAVEKLYENIKLNLSYEFQYDQCCLDIWINHDNQEDLVAYLIEINGRGGWGSSGSALYCWKYDPPIALEKQLRIRI
jgi:hypothetical protein